MKDLPPPPDPAEVPSRAGRAIARYVVTVFVAAALGAPWLYRGVRALAVHAPILAPLAAHPLYRYQTRLLQAFALAGLRPLLRTLRLRGWRDVGLAHPWASRRAFGAGALFGAGTTLAAAAVPLVAGGRVLDAAATPGRIAGRVLTALAVALVVALFEELLFRGVIDGGLRRAHASAGALAAGSAFYAGVHFLGRPAAPAAVHWASGLVALAGMLPRPQYLAVLAPPFLSLWLVGSYLGGLYHRAGTLLANVGVHAGGIFVLQLYGLVTTDAPGADARVWGTGWLFDGWSALGVLLAVGAVVRLARAARVRAALAVVDGGGAAGTA